MLADCFPIGVRERRALLKLTIACSAKARISLMALGARFLKLTPWHYNSGKEVTISLPPECHLLEKTLRDECFWSFGHSGLHKTNSSFVFRVRICVDASEDFFKISSRLSRGVDKQTKNAMSYLQISPQVMVRMVEWHKGGLGFPFHPRRTHTPTHTTHILFRNKFHFSGKVSCSLSIICLQN
jgi:hypothetical protein